MAETVRIVYESTKEGAPCRRLMVDMWVWVAADVLGEVCKEFANDSIAGLVKGRPLPLPVGEARGRRPWVLEWKKCYV